MFIRPPSFNCITCTTTIFMYYRPLLLKTGMHTTLFLKHLVSIQLIKEDSNACSQKLYNLQRNLCDIFPVYCN